MNREQNKAWNPNPGDATMSNQFTKAKGKNSRRSTIMEEREKI